MALRLISLFILSVCFSQAWASVATPSFELSYSYDENIEYNYGGFEIETSGISIRFGVTNEDNIHSYSKYAYGNNNPYKYLDPDGNSPLDIGFFIADSIKLGIAINSGNPAAIQSAAADLAGSAIGLISPVPGTGQFIKGARAGSKLAKAAKNSGRSGKQARLRELANDPQLGKADRGWIKQEQNSIARGNRKSIRNPPGKDLAHERGREASKGYGYKYSNLQDRKLHRTQHKFDNFGRKNQERPLQ